MNPVRPNIWSNVPPPGRGVGAVGGADKSAAQRAFFDQALGKATGAPQAQPQATPVAVQPARGEPVQRMPTAQPAEAPTRILRPGSLLDIRV